MASERTITLRLGKRVISVTPFDARGSKRLTIPVPIREKYEKSGVKLEEFPFVFIENDKGFLMMSLQDYLADKDVQGKGLAFAHLSGMSLKEIAERINKIAEGNGTEA